MKWICATVAPWALAGGLLVSFTASASNDAGSGVSAATRNAVAYLTDTTNLIPHISSNAGHMAGLGIGSAVIRNIPRYDLPDKSVGSSVGNLPRSDRKAHPVVGYPEVERTLKGN